MIRKYFLITALLLSTLIASAQIGAGQWKMHHYFIGENITNCIDVGDKVYYLTSGYLYCYDKSTQSNGIVDVAGVLNDNNISQIYYDNDKSYLFVVYSNCNIDIINQQGKVYNISAIKDVVLPKAKVVNDVTFNNGKAYVATSFGYIVIDEDSYSVVEVRNFDLNISSIGVVGTRKIMCVNNKFYYCNIDEQIETSWSYKQADNSLGAGKIVPINSSKFFLLNENALYKFSVSAASNGTLTFSSQVMEGDIPSVVQRYHSGFVASRYYYITTGSYGVKIKNYVDYYYTWDVNGNNATLHNGNSGFYSSFESGGWWVLSENGLTHYVNDVPGATVCPDGISIKDRAYWTAYDPSTQRVLLSRTSENRVLELWDGANSEINSWDGTQWHTVTPPNIGSYDGNYWLEVSSTEPNTYYFCSRKNGGVAKVQNDSIVIRYNKNNGPITDRANAIGLDSKGNLWMAQPRSETADVVAISAQNLLLSEVNPSHFVINDLGGACYSGADGGFKRMMFDIGAGDTKVYSSGNFNDPLIIWNNNDDLSLKQYKVFTSFNDQDNKNFSTYGWVYAKADNNGIMWLGTVTGVISFDPREAFDEDFRINRIKVTKKEGVEVNEVLLEGTQVNCIDCDSQNRKWIGTNSNGIYMVSPDGSEILKHFDMSNSPLPTDQIYSVCCNRATNSVLVVTGCGVLEYFYDMTPSASDYSNVYAYPNPVQSAFTGYVTINGLMENSNVVITDAAGATVATTTSTGGVAMWDACNQRGVPVKTGVYKVYAAQGKTPSTTGKPVTKIAVIK